MVQKYNPFSVVVCRIKSAVSARQKERLTNLLSSRPFLFENIGLVDIATKISIGPSAF